MNHVFPLHLYILQVIKNWMVGRPGNEASLHKVGLQFSLYVFLATKLHKVHCTMFLCHIRVSCWGLTVYKCPWSWQRRSSWLRHERPVAASSPVSSSAHPPCWGFSAAWYWRHAPRAGGKGGREEVWGRRKEGHNQIPQGLSMYRKSPWKKGQIVAANRTRVHDYYCRGRRKSGWLPNSKQAKSPTCTKNRTLLCSFPIYNFITYHYPWSQ